MHLLPIIVIALLGLLAILLRGGEGSDAHTAAITGAVGFATVVVLLNQLNVTNQQLVAETRPWVKLEPLEAGTVQKVEIASDKVTVWADFKITNIGKGPALKAFPFVQFAAQPIGPESLDPVAKPNQLCDDSKRNPGDLDGLGGAIFPGESFTATSGPRSLTREQIRAEQTVGPFGAAFARRPYAEQYLQHAVFWLEGCVAYTFDGSPDVHGTSFYWVITKAKGEPFDLSQPGVIDASDLKVRDVTMNRFAD